MRCCDATSAEAQADAVAVRSDSEPAAPAAALPTFGFVTVHDVALADGMAREAEWLARAAATGRAAAHLWRAPDGLVVPRSYVRLPGWADACAASANAGWPVQVRSSGGGIVPQGPGLLNLSLAWRVASATPRDTDAIYRALCLVLARALARLGVIAATHAVAGSFCDGRYNLAVGGRKLAGTAQAWRRIEQVPVVLAHALVVVDGDPQRLSDRANAFETVAGSDRRYRADALTSVEQAWRDAHRAMPPPGELHRRLRILLAESLARLIPPLTPKAA